MELPSEADLQPDSEDLSCVSILMYAVLGIKPGVCCVLGLYFATELHPQHSVPSMALRHISQMPFIWWRVPYRNYNLPRPFTILTITNLNLVLISVCPWLLSFPYQCLCVGGHAWNTSLPPHAVQILFRWEWPCSLCVAGSLLVHERCVCSHRAIGLPSVAYVFLICFLCLSCSSWIPHST